VGDGEGASFGEGGADGVGNFNAWRFFAEAGKDCGVGGRSAVVVAEEDIEGVGGGADNGDGFYGGFKRKSVALVFEEDDGFAGGVESELAIGGRVDIGEGELGPGDVCRRIEHAEAEAGFEETLDGGVDVLERDEAIFERIGERAILGAAGEVGAGFEGERGGLIAGEDEAMGLMKIADGPAVGDDVAAETPILAKKIEEKMVGAGGFAANGVVGAHDGIGVAVDDGGAEGGGVGVVEIVERNGDVHTMTENVGAAVNGEVFGSGDGFEVARVVALEAGDEGYTEAAGEEGIFTVGFLAASPARIAKDVDVGRPEGEAVVAAGIVVGDGVVKFGAGFGGNGVGYAVEEVGVPSSSEADGLRENGGGAGTGDAVEAFVPPVVGGDVEAGDGGGDVLHLGDFFVEGEA